MKDRNRNVGAEQVRWDAAVGTGERLYRAGPAWWARLMRALDLPITANQFLLLRAFVQLVEEVDQESYENVQIATYAGVDPAVANDHLNALARQGLIDRDATLASWLNQVTPEGVAMVAAAERAAGEASLAFLEEVGGLERWEGALPRRDAWRRPRRRRGATRR